MPTYKDPSNRLHFLSDADVESGGESYLPAGTVKITDAEADAIRAANQPEPTQEPSAKLAPLEFFDLFTLPEQTAVANAAMTNVQAKLWYDRMLAATFVTIDDPRTEAGLDALVGIGLLTAERKAQIVTAMS